ncbi:cytochrome c oxidase subunit 3 [Caballeronia sp. LjRoot31]|uniref:cytochrome c oxidase subunit 3 n=1 Tax=Caballeronia sp. LjRoot31 TaxID=3342324 RepID=UPI003ECED94F
MADVIDMKRPLPVGGKGQSAGGWWGMWTLIGTEAALFGYLIFSYLYLYSQGGGKWPPDGLPKMGPALFNTAVLLTSSVFVVLSERAVKHERRRMAMLWMSVAIVLGVLFVGVQLNEWHDHPYGPSAHLYGSLYFTITGFHMLHVVAGLVVLILLLAWTALGFFDDRRHTVLSIGGMYWHFVDIVWLFIFTTLYISPYVL